MKRSLVDASHWIAVFAKGDTHKKIGEEFLKWFEEQDETKSQIITTYSVLTEVIARLLTKVHFEKVIEVLEFITNNPKIDIYNENKKLKESIFEIFRTYEVLTLVDSELVVVYKNQKCHQLLTTDSRFNRCAGVNCYTHPQ